ncbi:ADP-glucose phosphorylase [Punica granatum]|uniref:ADP-glucose phosphorylase n=1 Tax=Punica granatum TaxID=22663 RepID=A0A218WLV5_PUNGR|nr:ADP-glucose phosphorylase [Punica granatum]OWM73231.1 hypothetical protein CDL15_Pgr001345 [Punica granatum]
MAAQAQSRQPELRKDAVTGRWVVFSPARSKRPSDLKSKSPSGSANESSDNCPFCAGNEHLCAPQIFRVPPDSAAEWRIRVIENLYPALDRNLGRPDGGGESGEVLGGFGYHDVVIEAPAHGVHLSDLPPREVGDVLIAYRKRIEQLAAAFDEIKYVQVFKNHGASAGASLSHSHSQIIALPVVPPNVSTRLGSMKDHFSRTGKCSLCELPLSDLVIEESTHFISFVPFAATFAFEIWIVPKIHSQHFHDIDDEKAADLGRLLKLMLKKISVQLNDPPFNFMIQTSPLHTTASELPYAHWFLQIVPQLSVVGGFELGTGCYINPVFPEDAAKLLREVNVPVQ